VIVAYDKIEDSNYAGIAQNTTVIQDTNKYDIVND
jgi:hypothetical protein